MPLLHIGVLAYNLNCQSCKNLSCKKCIAAMSANGFDDLLISCIHSMPDLNVEFLLDHHFLHYRGGCNWDGKAAEYHRIKTKALNELIDGVIAKNN